MWVREETVQGRNLTDIINIEKENVKYHPGFKLPNNVHANPDLLKSCQEADILIFILPHQYLPSVLNTLKNHLKPNVLAISLMKGEDVV